MSNTAVFPPREDGFARKRWSVSECRFLTENGLLTAGTYELLEGEVIAKVGQGRYHIFVVARIITILTALFGDTVQSQAQIGIGEIDAYNDPEPDVAVLRKPLHAYLERDPHPATDVLLVVEVANTTLQGDLTTKANLYARCEVPEYWVVAIPRRDVTVFRQPTPNGYTDIRTYSAQETLTTLALPDAPIPIHTFLP